MKIILNTPSKNSFEDIWLFLKKYLRANFENTHEYNFKKILESCSSVLNIF